MITVTLPGSGGIQTADEALKFLAEHVLVKKRDLDKIKKLAQKHGIYEELKALGVGMRELGPGIGGAWGTKVRKRPTAPASKKTKKVKGRARVSPKSSA